MRTEELLAADRYYDVQQFWGTVADFGFSKTREEALELWGHDRLLEEAVRVVRMTRPLVITSVFVGGPTDGHGHHSASGEIAQEVFAAAGDPNMFPEQIRAGLRPWSPLKMYARVPFFPISDKGMLDSATGKYHPVRFYDFIKKTWSDGPLSTNVEIPEGNGDPVLGATSHKSRGKAGRCKNLKITAEEFRSRRPQPRRITALLPPFRQVTKRNPISTASISPSAVSPVSPADKTMRF